MNIYKSAPSLMTRDCIQTRVNSQYESLNTAAGTVNEMHGEVVHA